MANIKPPKPMKGIDASTTKVMSHPYAKAILKDDMNIERHIMMFEIFSPSAPLKAKQSVAKFPANYD